MGNPGRNQCVQKIPVLGWRFFIGCAHAAQQHGDLQAAERHYIEALDYVEKSGNLHDVTSAVVLLELAEFYEDYGDKDRAQSVWARVRDVLGTSLNDLAPHQNVACTAGTIGSI